MEAENIFEITADRWAYGGEVIGRLPDGRAVFVAFALPGERLKIELTEEKRGFARARLLEVIEPSPERITARCKHYGMCGGCHFQHLDYPVQLSAKTAALRDTLGRIGKFESDEIDAFLQDFVPAPTPWEYRNHIQLHLDEEGRLGYLAPGSDQVVPIDECYLPEDAISQIWPQLKFEPIPTLERVSLRQGIEDEVMLVFKTEDDEGLEFSLDIPLAAVQIGPNSLHVLSDSAELEMEVLGMRFQVSAGAFFQVNTAMAAKMIEYLLEHLPLKEESVVLDIYCGVGLFSAFLAEHAGRVIGIEENPLAVEDFAENLDAFDNVEVYEAPAEVVMPQLDVKPDVIVVDPPRTGLALPVLDAIVKMQPGSLAYVSCDPATFARDAKRLKEAGFRLLHLTPFDLFPQTYHIETISLWERGN